jgi:hypothetical protein
MIHGGIKMPFRLAIPASIASHRPTPGKDPLCLQPCGMQLRGSNLHCIQRALRMPYIVQ